MTSKMTTLEHLPDVLDDMLSEFQKANFELRQEAIQAGADVLKAALESDSAEMTGGSEFSTGEYAKSWDMKVYPDHRYVGNTKTAKGVVHRKTKSGKKGQAREGVPLSNVLEYAENSPHVGRIRRCFDSNENKIYEAMKKVITNGGK